MREYRAPSIEGPRQSIPKSFDRPMDLELGTGVGLFALRYSARNPGRTLVTIERNNSRCTKLRRRLANHSPRPNLISIHAEATSWIANNIEASSIDNCFIWYPTPYPKHRNRRWFAMPFFGELLNKLKSCGRVHLASNHLWYIEEARSLSKEWGLDIVSQSVIKQKADLEPRTHFEKKYLESGEECYELVVEKLANHDCSPHNERKDPEGLL